MAFELGAEDVSEASPEEAAHLRSAVLRFEPSTDFAAALQGRHPSSLSQELSRADSMASLSGVGPGWSNDATGGTRLTKAQRSHMLARIAEMAGDVPGPEFTSERSLTVDAEYTPFGPLPVPATEQQGQQGQVGQERTGPEAPSAAGTPTRVGRIRPAATQPAKPRRWLPGLALTLALGWLLIARLEGCANALLHGEDEAQPTEGAGGQPSS